MICDMFFNLHPCGNENFKEIVVGTSHRILKQRLRRAQQKQMHGASTIPY